MVYSFKPCLAWVTVGSRGAFALEVPFHSSLLANSGRERREREKQRERAESREKA